MTKVWNRFLVSFEDYMPDKCCLWFRSERWGRWVCENDIVAGAYPAEVAADSAIAAPATKAGSRAHRLPGKLYVFLWELHLAAMVSWQEPTPPK
jgi:hypothetical protein